jgi:15-cis-phytoene synthase
VSTITTLHRDTFRAGSRTYYNSSIFFPERVKEDVYLLYGFVRTADNYVDSVPQDGAGFRSFVERYRTAVAGTRSGDPIIDPFVELADRKGFDPKWTDAFLYSMELDLTKRIYRTLDETLEYIYGSAEVIGLYMAKILDLDERSYRFAELQGRAMQYINFIRDIDEDRRLGRVYLPLGDSGFEKLDRESALANPGRFESFVRKQIERYDGWQREAEAGYRYIPRRYRIPIRTASDMYNWTARTIDRDPFLVFDRQVKPGKARVVMTALANFLKA